jgi:adenylate cyclase
MVLSLRAKILCFGAGLVLVLLAASLVVLNVIVTRQIRRTAEADLQRTRAAFEAIRAQRDRQLLAASRLLSADYAFRSVVATYDPATVQSAAQGFQQALGSDLLAVADERGVVLAWTDDPARVGSDVAGAPWARAALAGQEAADLLVQPERGAIFQLTAVPVRPAEVAPDVMGILILGFRVDDAVAGALRRLTESEVSFAAGGRLVASTLPESGRETLLRRLPELRSARGPLDLGLGAERFLALAVPLAPAGTGPDAPPAPDAPMAIVQRSLEPALAALRRVQRGLGLVGLVAVAVAVAASALISKGITEPVRRLVEGTQRVAAGVYDHPIAVRARDELGTLAEAFNAMMHGLWDRERVRGLMQKIVSKEIAEEMLRGPVELGGEERSASVLFCDIRDFTSWTEGLPPRELVGQLNDCLTVMAAAVDAHRGVVDKFIGDAVMAVFGVPVPDPDHAARAVGAALDMVRALDELNARRAAAARPPLRIGVGIATGTVVAGNMGSADRLNYTVVGDDVNLAARLEGLTKTAGAPIVISEATHAGLPAGRFRTRALGEVQVKGKRETVRVFVVEPGRPGEAPPPEGGP